MTDSLKKNWLPLQELTFQVILHGVVFIFYSFDRNQPQIAWFQVVFFLNYALAAFIINYVLLPRFYYRKKYLFFLAGLVFVVVTVVFIEEAVLEAIYYPDTRGKFFPGIFYCLLDVLPVITILSGFKFAWDAMRKQREVDDLKSTVKESELQFLKSQINPHFLFNNLNNLYAYAIEQSPKTPEIILELSGILRYMLYECKEEYVSLTKEVQQMENFINLSEMQIEERGVVNFSRTNIREGYRIAPLILVVFIENAFKHSTASQTDNIYIDVKLELLPNGTLEFICTNSFHRQSNTDSLAHGIGLENVKKRLELLYPGAYQLAIIDTDDRYEVRLNLDL
jgi:uncharacterized membrane protein